MFLILPLTLLVSVSCCNCLITYDTSIYGESQNGYYVTLNLGTPPQKINFILDTSSSNIAVATVTPVLGIRKYFRYNESNTLRQLEIAVDLHYVVGQWNGFLAKDVIGLGNSTIECTIACMVSIYQIFDANSPFQGLLGLAYPSIALPDSSIVPFIDNLVKVQNMTDIFCLDLCGPFFSSNVQATTCGEFHMGHISKLYSNDDIIYTPIIKKWYYEILLTDLKVGMSYAPIKCQELNKDRSIVDSGTTDLLLPKRAYNWTITEIRNSVKYAVADKFWINETVACFPRNHLNITTFPSITLTFYHSKISTFDLIISPELYLLPLEDKNSNDTCFKLAFGVSDHGVLIGSSVLKGYYVVFDRINNRIGFGNSSQFHESKDFPGFVLEPKFRSLSSQWCKGSLHSSPKDISPMMIAVLFTAVLVTIVLLGMLVSWIFKHFITRSGESSETSSLVDGISLETWK